MTIRAHIFTDISAVLFLKHVPDFSTILNDVEFSFGLDIPDNIDVLILYTRASYSIPTTLPKNRTAFYAGEPDVIHPYSTRFLNQFGIVLTTSPKELDTVKLHETVSAMSFVGIDFTKKDNPLNITYFEDMECPKKDNKISIVTSNKSHTKFHQNRLKFIDIIAEKIPDHIELYGHGFKPINDKKDALLNHKYHIALENGGGPYAWTEKLSDPLLCWAFPFYHGCTNVEDDIPATAFDYIDINNPDQVVNQIMTAVKEDLWDKRKNDISIARDIVFSEFNIMKKFAQITHQLVALDPKLPKDPKRLIRSERSLWPEKECRGSIPETLIRSTLLYLNPNIEMKAATFLKKRKDRRAANRSQKKA